MTFESFSCSAHGLCALLGPIEGLAIFIALAAFTPLAIAAIAAAAILWRKSDSATHFRDCLVRECGRCSRVVLFAGLLAAALSTHMRRGAQLEALTAALAKHVREDEQRHEDSKTAHLLIQHHMGACSEAWRCPTVSSLTMVVAKNGMPNPMWGWLAGAVWTVQDRCNASLATEGRPSYAFAGGDPGALAYAVALLVRRGDSETRGRSQLDRNGKIEGYVGQLMAFAGPDVVTKHRGNALFLWYSAAERQWVMTRSAVGIERSSNESRPFIGM